LRNSRHLERFLPLLSKTEKILFYHCLITDIFWAKKKTWTPGRTKIRKKFFPSAEVGLG